MELFGSKNLPLSKRMMPRTLDDLVGQSQLTVPGKPIRTMLESGIIHSMIFFGPPATGKTSLAEIIALQLQCDFVRTNALTLTNEQIRDIIAKGEMNGLAGKKTIVFVDEIHRLNKPKQDVFLSSLENGDIIIIGATTENPFFIMQPALRSRVFIYEFKSLTRDDMQSILESALRRDKMFADLNVEFEEGAKEKLLDSATDPRMLLNTLEMAVLSRSVGERNLVTRDAVGEILQRPDTMYSSEEGHYDVISAFIKSVRGSAVDAALYYLALMLESGEDPLFIARRLIILASEDIGLAYPEALPIAVACYQAIERIGMPEGQLVLSETTILLSAVPKSNTALVINQARGDVRSGKILPIPPHLKNAVFEQEKDFGKGVGYKYPHSYPNHFVDEKYTTEPVEYYTPGELGFEKRIKEWLYKLKNPEKEN